MWKLKDEETVILFTREMATRNDDIIKADDDQQKWLLMKETWWWNRDVEEMVAKRKVCHKAWRISKSDEDKHTLDVDKKEAYTAVLAVQVTRIH